NDRTRRIRQRNMFFRGAAHRHRLVRHLGMRGNRRTGCDQRTVPDRRLVEHDGTITDQRLFTDGAGVHQTLVPDGDVAPDFTGALVEMHHGVVLDVRALADQNPSEIGTQYRAVPDRRALFHDNVANQCRSRRYPGFGVNIGRFSLESEVRHAHTVLSPLTTSYSGLPLQDGRHGTCPVRPGRYEPRSPSTPPTPGFPWPGPVRPRPQG